MTARLWVFPELVSTPPEGVYQRLMLTLCVPAPEDVVSLTTMFSVPAVAVRRPVPTESNWTLKVPQAEVEPTWVQVMF